MNHASTLKINLKSNLLSSIENLEKLEKICRKPSSIILQPFSNLFSTFGNLDFFSNFLSRVIPIQALGRTLPIQARVELGPISRVNLKSPPRPLGSRRVDALNDHQAIQTSHNLQTNLLGVRVYPLPTP